MPNAAPVLKVQQLGVVFPDNNGGLRALDRVSFEICPREFVCVLGASGSGKTTLLRTLAGLLQPTAGSVTFAGGRTPRIGMVFQQSNLMPCRTVMGNVALPLELSGLENEDSRVRVQEMVVHAHDPLAFKRLHRLKVVDNKVMIIIIDDITSVQGEVCCYIGGVGRFDLIGVSLG